MSTNQSTTGERFEIQITSTARSYRPEDDYRVMDSQRLIANSIDEVREKLIDLYGTCKRVPMYVDGPQNSPTQVGWIYCFNIDANDRGELKKWRQQDWVQVMRLTGEVVDPLELKRQ